MSQALVEYQTEDHIATITMNDPKTLNAFSTVLKNAMMAALTKADEDEQVRVIILQGAGNNFSSGGHIGEMLENGMESEALSDKLNFMVGEVAEISLKLRNIAADNAKFVQAFVNIGLIPDAGGIYLLNQLIGVAKTTEMVMLGDKLKAEDMERLNLVNDVVSSDELDASVLALATRLSNLPGKALASMKHMINTHAYMGLNEALDMEVDQQTMLAKTDDFKEGITAFMEKRKPVYQGK